MMPHVVSGGCCYSEILAVPSYKKSLFIFIALLYAYVILYLPVLTSKDSASYYVYANIAMEELFRAFESGVISGLLREPVWLLLISFVSYIFAWNHDYVLFSISFFSSFMAAYSSLGRIKGGASAVVMLLLLTSSFFIGNFVTHLREGVALAIFLIGLNAKNSIIKNILLSITPFIHVVFFIILSMYYFSMLLSKLKVSKFIVFFLAVTGMIIMSVVVNYFLEGSSFRQASAENAVSGSGVGFLYWLVYLLVISSIYIFYKKRSFTVISLMSLFVLMFYLMNYYYFYAAARVLEVGLFFVAISAANSGHVEKYFFIAYVSLFVSVGWLLRLSEYNLGY